MLQRSEPLDLVNEEEGAIVSSAPPQAVEDRNATVWASRISRVIGAIFLLIALFIWAARPGHYRLVFFLLTVAMFAAILHAYTYQNGNGGY